MTGPEVDTSTAQRPAGTARDADNFVPAWLAGLVLVLLLAVMGLGGYVLRGVVAGDGRVADVADEEIATWREAVAKNPEDLSARVSLGYAYQQAGRYDKAVEEYQRVVEKDPRNTAALYNMGVVYLELDVDDKAEEALWDVLEAVPDHALAAKQLGQLYLERGQYRSMLKAVRPVVESHPEIADLQYLTGVAYENLGRTEWAVARYKLALSYSPDYVEATEALERLGEAQ